MPRKLGRTVQKCPGALALAMMILNPGLHENQHLKLGHKAKMQRQEGRRMADARHEANAPLEARRCMMPRSAQNNGISNDRNAISKDAKGKAQARPRARAFATVGCTCAR